MNCEIKEVRMDESSKIRASMSIKSLCERMSECEPVAVPRPHVALRFEHIKTVTILYEQFVGILEWNAETDSFNYVAMGWNPSGDLSNGDIEIVDVRVLDEEDHEVFQHAVNHMARLQSKSSPVRRTISEPVEVKQILDAIVEVWLASTQSMGEIIH
jgi:hypothetical protein